MMFTPSQFLSPSYQWLAYTSVCEMTVDPNATPQSWLIGIHKSININPVVLLCFGLFGLFTYNDPYHSLVLFSKKSKNSLQFTVALDHRSLTWLDGQVPRALRHRRARKMVRLRRCRWWKLCCLVWERGSQQYINGMHMIYHGIKICDTWYSQEQPVAVSTGFCEDRDFAGIWVCTTQQW